MSFIIHLAVASIIIVFFAWLGIISRRVLFPYLEKASRKTRFRADDIIVKHLGRPWLFWFFLAGLYFAFSYLKLPAVAGGFLTKIIIISAIASATLFLMSLLPDLIAAYGEKIETTLPVTGLTQNITKIVILVIGFLIGLNSLGISITPLLTTLGIGGLAVALALQDTLANLFSGFHIIMAKQIKIGDYIELESGQKGYIEDITWRFTKIRMLPNNIILIPNSKLAQTIITNYYLPQKDLAVLVDVGVHYESDLEKVEKVTIEVGEEVMKEVEGGVPEFKPFIRFHTFADFSINFTVILRAKKFVDRYLIKHEFVKRLQRRYKQEGIVIPYPITALNSSQENFLPKN